jgi:hypothetical protein
MKSTIRELQRNGYKKTSTKGLYLTNNGKAYNVTTNNHLSILRQGKVLVNGKEYNIAKLILETFKKTPLRNGAIVFLNGNNKDFDCNNLQYATGTHYKAPTQASIIKCLRLYFEVDKNINRNSTLFKLHLKQIALKREFIYLHKDRDFNLFLSWLVPHSESKANISTENGYTVINGTDIINKYLQLLVNECLQDHENGLLQIIDFAPKPLTQTEKNKKTNEILEKSGFTSRMPLRKPRTK